MDVIQIVKKSRAMLLLALNSRDIVYGRTRIQKMIYLANEIGLNVVPDYSFYQYGPYSKLITTELEELKEQGYVEETKEQTSNQQTIYRYKLTDKGKEALKALEKEFTHHELKVLKELFNNISNNSKYSLDDLEIMTSLVEIKKDVNDMDKVIDIVHKLKPRFTKEDIKSRQHVFELIEEYKKKLNT